MYVLCCITNRVMEQYPNTEMAKFAHFCETNLLRTRNRDYPPSKDEVIACLVSTENLCTHMYIAVVLCMHACMHTVISMPLGSGCNSENDPPAFLLSLHTIYKGCQF